MKIHLVYFSCGHHFSNLLYSLKSLELLNISLLGKVYVYIDRNDTLSKEQEAMVYDLHLSILIAFTRYPMARSGLNVILNELIAFELITEACDSSDYIGKVDSDILFVSDSVFDKVSLSSKDMYGEKIFNGFQFVQGGCYFIAVKAIPRLLVSPLFYALDYLYGVKNINELTLVPEDAVIYLLMKIASVSIGYGKYMDQAPLDVRTKMDVFEKEISMIHFSGESRVFMQESFSALFGH